MGFFKKFKKSLKSQNKGNETENFKYLDKLIHRGVEEIVLESDIVLTGWEKFKYKEGIKLDVDDIVIDGNGHTIDACGEARIFYCTGKNITIKNITLKNGFGHSGASNNERILAGGAICNMGGELTVIGSSFVKNFSKNYAGAIYNMEGKLTILESTFLQNTTESSGGAIESIRGNLIIEKSSFVNNDAKYNAGAVGNNRSDVTISECTFTSNTSGGGGAIDNLVGEISISKCKFVKNTSNTSGTIFNWGELTIKDSKFSESIGNDEKGLIYNHMGILKIFDCEISGNISQNSIIINKDSLQLTNTQFMDNESEKIILNQDDTANLSIFNTKFLENNVGKAVVCNDGKFSSIERSIFENNLANNESENIINNTDLKLTIPQIKDDGKTILNNGNIIMKIASPDLLSKIHGNGNVESVGNLPNEEKFDFGYLNKKIHENDAQLITLNEDICFENYESDYYEGGIELDRDNLIIDGNGKTIDGANKSRIFIITGKNIVLKNITFKNGYSHKDYDNPFNNNGGVLKINRDINLTIDNCEFVNSTSEDKGGAIHNSGNLTISDSKFVKNIAKRKFSDGGAIDNKGVLTISKSLFDNNSAKDHGGAINNEGKLKILESTLNNNVADHAGAIYNIGLQADLEIFGSIFNDNTSQEGSGGVVYTMDAKLNISQSSFTQNSAQNYGGAIHISRSEVSISKSAFNNNSCLSGGAIDNWSNLTISESTFNSNIADDNGGAISNHEAAELTIFKSIFSENTAEKDGGAIYNYGHLKINESTFDSNTAQENSGAIQHGTKKRFLKTKSCQFKNNHPMDLKYN